MDMLLPDVVTTLRKSDYNFEFRVLAYRHLSEQEMISVLKSWMQQTQRKNIPKNKIVTYQTTIEFDD